MKTAILMMGYPESAKKWEVACENRGIEYIRVDLNKNEWFSKIKEFNPDFCLGRPPGNIILEKKTYDEKVYFLERNLKLKIFPSWNESFIYENKAVLSHFLRAAQIPHPETFVSYNLEESQSFASKATYPLVAKTLIGAAGSGVKIINTRVNAEQYVNNAFAGGIKRRYGPNRKTGSPAKWLKKAISSPKYFLKKLKEYKLRETDTQKGVVLFQEYIRHDFEWRCVRIGESYFAYKKLIQESQASGSKLFDYGEPPFEILDFTRELCEKHNFIFMAVDLFHNETGIYVNELQTLFGHKNPHICKVNDTPGRYVFKGGQWVFEPGDFNTNESYDLRLDTIVRLFEKA